MEVERKKNIAGPDSDQYFFYFSGRVGYVRIRQHTFLSTFRSRIREVEENMCFLLFPTPGQIQWRDRENIIFSGK